MKTKRVLFFGLLCVFVIGMTWTLTGHAAKAKWECINNVMLSCNTWRMPVFHGWIVSSDNGATGGEHGYAMVYVPDEMHKWDVTKL